MKGQLWAAVSPAPGEGLYLCVSPGCSEKDPMRLRGPRGSLGDGPVRGGWRDTQTVKTGLLEGFSLF